MATGDAMRQSSTLNRRLFIKAAGRFVGSTAVAGSMLSLGSSMPVSPARSQPNAPPTEPLIQPPEIRSVNGMLDTTITAAPGQVQLGDRAFAGLLYNGAYVPPTLRARLGDTLRITFRNNLTSGLERPGFVGPICSGPGTPSNLHFHGIAWRRRATATAESSMLNPTKHPRTRDAHQRP